MKFEELKKGDRVKHPDYPGIVAEVIEIDSMRVSLAVIGRETTFSYYRVEFDGRLELIEKPVLANR